MKKTLGLCLLFFLASCNLFKQDDEGDSRGAAGAYESYVIPINPVAQSEYSAERIAENFYLDPYLSSSPVFITENEYLQEDCQIENEGVLYPLPDCFSVQEKPSDTQLLRRSEESWNYSSGSDEFLQVHTFYHTKKAITLYFDLIKDIYTEAMSSHLESSFTQQALNQNASWSDTPLKVFAKCDDLSNAYYDPALTRICLGEDLYHPGHVFSQDPSIIYHELGHHFVKVFMNMRNKTAGLTLRSDLGMHSYDEGGALNEGIADYFAVISRILGNDSKRRIYRLYDDERFGVGELSLSLYNSFRPTHEGHSLHHSGIAPNAVGRFNYTEHLNHSVQSPSAPVESNHTQGQVVSHYLTSLTLKMSETCSYSFREATSKVIFILAETLAHLGDLSSLGSTAHGNGYTVNFNPVHSLEWLRNINPINFRRFFQSFAFFLKNKISNQACLALNPYSLLDEYHLLLFSTDNGDGNDELLGHNGVNRSSIPQYERQRSVMLTKGDLDLATGNYPQAYIADDRLSMVDLVSSLQDKFGPILPREIPANLGFNNGGGRPSPGEVVGLHLNLFNYNPSHPYLGIHISASEFDYTKTNANGYEEPCSDMLHQWPSPHEGAAPPDTHQGAGSCSYITRNHGLDGDEVSPVCFVWNHQDQKWTSQANTSYADDGLCLDDDQKNCLLKFLKGGKSAHLSRIAPQKTWVETQHGQSAQFSFPAHSMLFMAINPVVPYGTRFYCNFRVRASNCSDCHETTGGDDYLSYENSGVDPFQIISLEFTVEDDA